MKLLSIVVPTKNRYEYLKHFVRLIRSFNNDDIELVIQDNSDNNSDFLSFLESLSYPSLKYFYQKESIPISKNSDLAILNSTGEYVCYMGDDDAVMPNIYDWVVWMKKNGVEALKSSNVIYYWPDSKPGKHINNSGRLICQNYSQKIRMVDPPSALDAVLKQGCLNKGEIPLVYHGIVRRDVLDRCYEKTSTFFPAPCPDIANGVAMSLLVENYAIVDEPVILSGASMHHGGKSALKGKYLRLEDMHWMSESEKNEWDIRLLKYGVAESIYANSTIKVLERFNRPDLLSRLKFERYYAWLLVNYSDLRQDVFSLTKPSLKLFINYAYCLTKKLIDKIIDVLCFVLKRERNAFSAGPFLTISDAVNYLEHNNEE